MNMQRIKIHHGKSETFTAFLSHCAVGSAYICVCRLFTKQMHKPSVFFPQLFHVREVELYLTARAIQLRPTAESWRSPPHVAQTLLTAASAPV